jgi:WD40 repeat protein
MCIDHYVPEIRHPDARKSLSGSGCDMSSVICITRPIYIYSVMFKFKPLTQHLKSLVTIMSALPSFLNNDLAWEEIVNLDGHAKIVNTLKFSPNGEFLATGDDAGCLLVCALCRCLRYVYTCSPMLFFAQVWKTNSWIRYRTFEFKMKIDICGMVWDSPYTIIVGLGNGDLIRLQLNVAERFSIFISQGRSKRD